MLVPAYNAEHTIAMVVMIADKYGKVIVYNDGSTDPTEEIAMRCGARVIGNKVI